MPTITIPNWKSFQFRELFLIMERYPTGETKRTKSIGFAHIDSSWKNHPDVDLAPLSTGMKGKDGYITLELVMFNDRNNFSSERLSNKVGL